VLCFIKVQQLEFSLTFIQTYFALMHHAESRSVHNLSTGVQNESNWNDNT